MGHVNSHSQAGVGLLAKAFRILDLFQTDSPSWTQSEIARRSGIHRSTVSRLVRYLSETGFLVHYAETGRYGLGLAAIDLGRRAGAGFDLRALGQPIMEELSQATGETIILTELNRNERDVTCVEQIEGRHGGLRVFEHVGATFPLHAGAAPKAILAQFDEVRRESYLTSPLAKVSENTLTDAESLRADLSRISARGYSVSREETYPGVAGVGAAFSGPDHRPVGSLAIAAPVQRVDAEKIDHYGHLLMTSARKMSALLHGRDSVEGEFAQ